MSGKTRDMIIIPSSSNERLQAEKSLEAAKKSARRDHKFLKMAQELDPNERDKIHNFVVVTREVFGNDDANPIFEFVAALLDDINGEMDFAEIVYFLRRLDMFLPAKGRPPNLAEKAAIYWLLVHRNAEGKPIETGLQMGEGGTQRETCETITELDKNLRSININLTERAIQGHLQKMRKSGELIGKSLAEK